MAFLHHEITLVGGKFDETAFYGILVTIMAIAVVVMLSPNFSNAASPAAQKLDRDATKALADLYATTPKAKELGKKAVGILIFPSVIKAGFVAAGQYGDGVLRKNGKTVAFYNSLAASWGLQAGIKKFGYAVFFMTKPALKYLRQERWLGAWRCAGRHCCRQGPRRLAFHDIAPKSHLCFPL